MTYCSTYIGDLADPAFHWDGGDWNGNIPRGISPAFPPVPTPNNYNRKFHDWVKSTKVTCKQTDYGGWVARVGNHTLVTCNVIGYDLNYDKEFQAQGS
jgi:hypothetical protein